MKSRDILNMGKAEREKKLKELKMELIKAKAGSSKTSSSKVKQIRKIIAKILTTNKQKAESDSAEKVKEGNKK